MYTYIFRDLSLHVDHCVNSVNINFTLHLVQGAFIDRIYRINHTETSHFNAPTLVTSVSHKIAAKGGILCPKTPLLTEKQLHAIHFFVASRNVCPLAIPESCAQNMGLRLLENLSDLRVGVALRASVETLYERLNTEVCERKIPLHFPFFIAHRYRRLPFDAFLCLFGVNSSI